MLAPIHLPGFFQNEFELFGSLKREAEDSPAKLLAENSGTV
jgi:hypothetical protein